jgi:hypothetical protein
MNLICGREHPVSYAVLRMTHVIDSGGPSLPAIRRGLMISC